MTVTDLTYGGAGIAHIGNFIIFIKNAIPGQRLMVRITKIKASYAEARILEIIEQSPEYQSPPCPYFEHCGGCTHQQLAYKTQLRYLHKQVLQLYQHLGGFGQVEVLSPIASEDLFRYRNKMEFAFSDKRWLIDELETDKPKDFALGLRATGNFLKAIDIDDCLIAPEETRIVLETIRNFSLENSLSCYNQRSHTGYLRHLVLRKAHKTQQLMINIVTNEDHHEVLSPLVDILSERLPPLKSVVNTISRSWSGTTFGETQHLLYGKDHIIETLGSFTFKISPASFFQTNTIMAEKLYNIIKEYAGLTGTETVWDLYCGTGSIALYLANRAREIIGFEIVSSAVKDARENANLNQLSNLRFIECDLDRLPQKNPELLDTLPRPQILIIDPPRAGMHPKLIPVVAKLNPSRIVYISCNPATQVRDIKLLLEQTIYHIDLVQPVDMFPHTPHIEVVTRLEKQE